MGCHTWFSVPFKTGKKEIIDIAQLWLNKQKIGDDYRKMYQFAIDNELEEPVCEFAGYEVNTNRSENWTIYMNVEDYSLLEYNKLHNTNYRSKFDKEVYGKILLESYSDEPRIGGYPDAIIHSYEEMEEAMETGLIGIDYDDEYNELTKVYYFDIDENRKEMIMQGIKTFFEKHPEGIITFG